MTKHLYLSVNCKTPECNTTIPVKHFGVYEGQEEIREATPERVQYTCSRCHKSHWYLRGDMFAQLLPYGPPPGWENGWQP